MRWHMRHIFAKLGITRQVEWVQRVLAGGVSDRGAEAVFGGAHCAFYSLNSVNPFIWVATGRACCRSFPTTPLLGLGSSLSQRNILNQWTGRSEWTGYK